MNWKCPDDWAIRPKHTKAAEGMMFSLMFSGMKRWNYLRTPWFRKCNKSGKWIWPYQKAWHGVVSLVNAPYDSGAHRGGSFALAWLKEEHFLVEKLKGTI